MHLARDIHPFVMYCVNEKPRSSLLIESTDCMIMRFSPLHGYSIFRKDRGSRGGGILVAVADSIPIKLIPSPSNLEALTIMISYSKGQILLCCVYIPPNPDAHYFCSYVSYLSNLVIYHESILFLGDFNLPDIYNLVFTLLFFLKLQSLL